MEISLKQLRQFATLVTTTLFLLASCSTPSEILSDELALSSELTIASFTLINADTDQAIAGFDPLPDGATLNLATLPTRNLNIRANSNPSLVGSVLFGLNDASNFKMENAAPYAMSSDSQGDYYAWTPALGSYTVTATPFSRSNARGTVGQALSISFSVIEQVPAGGSVTSFTLINADTNQPMAGYDPLPDGATLDLATLPTRNLNIRANTNPTVVGSVRFGLNGNSNYRTESAAPYAMASDNQGDYHIWTPAVGRHTVTATPYSRSGARGTVGGTLSLGFTVIDRKPSPVIAAAGDIACDPSDQYYNGGQGTTSFCRMKATSDLLVAMNPDAVAVLGDAQYSDATYQKFMQSYDASWGRLKHLTYPAVGNHEYLTAGAAGYFDYFGAAAGERSKGYYSYDLGGWHVVVLNSACAQVGGCGVGSAQERWLREDLAAHTSSCVLAYWHSPRFSSGRHGNNSATSAFWQALYEAGAEVILASHDHTYERFAPQTPAGVADSERGIRQFVVGTGGKSLYSFGTVQTNSEVRNDHTYGVLKLTLHPTSYEWQFVSEAGKTFTDSGSATCH